jgi:hypothetical protein
MVREIVGVAVGVLFLAGFAVAVKPGSQFGNVLKIGFDGFGGLVKDATLQSSS